MSAFLPNFPARPPTARGFTLLELLAVITTIGVLAALVIPTVSAVRTSADRVRTRVQFSQWAVALAQFHQEYGYFPALGTDHALRTAADTVGFVRALSGRNPDGSEVAAAADLLGNTRRIAFHNFAEPEFRAGLLADALGNTEIALLADTDGDGLVKPGIDGLPPAVRAGAGPGLVPSAADLPPGGVRASVIFYSAGRGLVDSDLILSWK